MLEKFSLNYLFYTYIHSFETGTANERTYVSRMQNCPITTSPYRRYFSLRYLTLRRKGFCYKTVRGHFTRLNGGGPGGGLEFFVGSGYQTLRRGAFTTRLYEGTLPGYTAEALAGAWNFFVGSGYQTLRRGAFTTRLYEGILPDYAAEARGVWIRILCGKKLWASAPHSLTTILHGGERQNNKHLRCRLPPLFA